MKKIDRKYWVIFLVTMLTVIEQVTKVFVVMNKDKFPITIIDNFLMFSYVENSGAAFGIQVGSIWTFILVNIVVLGILIKFVHSQMNKISNQVTIVLSLILAGGISNLIDRIFRGAVIDFIDLGPILNFPVFNVADIMLVIGVLMFTISLIISTIKDYRKDKKSE